MPHLKSPLLPSEYTDPVMQSYEDLNELAKNFRHPLLKDILSHSITEKLPRYGQNTKSTTAHFANHARVFTHYQILSLMDDFLNYKHQYGTALERQLYDGMCISEFIDRLLINRPLTFYTKKDVYLPRGGTQTYDGGFETLPSNTRGLQLTHSLSYDEMLVSAFLGVSSQTYFINNGRRDNCGSAEKYGSFEEYGIFIGLVGARFEKPGFMEWQHLIITAKQNTLENGYGRFANQNDPKAKWLNIFAKLYYPEDEMPAFPTFDEVTQFSERYPKSKRYLYLPSIRAYLNTELYKRRMQLVIEPFLLECNQRAKEQFFNMKAYVHAVGLGLGAWQLYPVKAQEELLVSVYAEILSKREFDSIEVIDFSYFNHVRNCSGVKSGETFPGTNIKIHFSNRNPADLLSQHKILLTAQFAWDSNAYIGNEFWINQFTSSGDPAAVCCSQIGWLLNPLINNKICGLNTYFLADPGRSQNYRITDIAKAQMEQNNQLDNHIQSHEQLRLHYELDTLCMRFALSRKTRDNDDDRIILCNIILERLNKMSLHPIRSPQKIEQERNLWTSRKKQMSMSKDPRSSIPRFQAKGIRAAIGATLSTLLFDGNSEDRANALLKIPYITLSNDTGLVLYIPDYSGEVDEIEQYGYRLYHALKAIHFDSVHYRPCDIHNKFGRFIVSLQITSGTDIKRLIEEVCGFNPQATSDMFKSAHYSPPKEESTIVADEDDPLSLQL